LLRSQPPCSSQFLHFPTHIFYNGFKYISKLHKLQIDSFRDNLIVTFHDLAILTTGNVPDVESQVPLPLMTEFFHDEWILNMTMKFVQITESLSKISQHMSLDTAVTCSMTLFILGLMGLAMLLESNQVRQ